MRLNTRLVARGKKNTQKNFTRLYLLFFSWLISAQCVFSQSDSIDYSQAKKLAFDEDYKNAIELFGKLETRFRISKKDTLYVDVLNNLALAHLALYNYPNAEKYVQKALDFTQPAGNDSSLLFADALGTKASILFDQSLYRAAEQLCQRAINIYRKAGQTESSKFWIHSMRLVEIWTHIIENPRKDIIENFVPNARLNAQRAEKKFKINSFENAYSKLWYGVTLSMSGDFEKSDSVMQITHDWAKLNLSPDHPKRFEFLFLQISALHTQIQRNNNIKKNFDLSQQAYQLACKVDSNGRRHGLAGFAMAYASLLISNLDTFTKYSEEGIRIFAQLKCFNEIKFTLLNNYAQVLSYTENHEEALPFYEQAHKALKAGDYLRDDDYGSFLRALGSNELDRGLFKEADEHLSEAIRLLENSNKDDMNDVSLAQARVALVVYYLTVQRFDEAYRQIQKVVKVYNLHKGSIPKTEYWNAIFLEGVILAEFKQKKEAIQLMKQVVDSLKNTPLEKSFIYVNANERLAGLYIYERQNLDQANQYLDQATTALKAFMKNESMFDLFIEADRTQLFLAQKDGIQALSSARKAIQLVEKQFKKHYYLLEDLYRKYAVVNYVFGSSDSVNATLRKMLYYNYLQANHYVNFMSEEDRERYMLYTLKSSAYTTYNFSFYEKKINPTRLGIAYDMVLHNKGLLLSSFQTTIRKIKSSQDSNTITLFNNWVRLRTRLANEYTRAPDKISPENINNLQDYIERAEKDLSMRGANIKELKELKNYKWQNIQKGLKPNEAAIEIINYSLFNLSDNYQIKDTSTYAALIVRPEWTAPHLILLPNGKDLETKWLQSYRNNLTKAQPSGEIYRQFWQPVAEALKGVKKAYIAPDGVYHLVSLPTLYNATTKRFLADELELIVVGSTREVLEKQTPTQNSTAVLFGFPAYDSRPVAGTSQRAVMAKQQRSGMAFKELPATKTEIQMLEKLFKNTQIKTSSKLGIEATEEALKKVEHPRILHIATHGFFRDTLTKGYQISPLISCGLALAGASDTTSYKSDTEDGILTGYEAGLLNLAQTELVTLSACDTGLGDVKAGEGVFGLQRAFLNSGAKAVLMSLWKLDDDLMQEFMTHFYTFWLSGLTKPQALQKAQTRMRQRNPQPYYWGNFVLLGK